MAFKLCDKWEIIQWRGDRDFQSFTHGRRSRGGQVPPEFGVGELSPQILSCCKILSTRLLALQCRKMWFWPLQQDFYSKSGHASPLPQNSSQIYAYGFAALRAALCRKFGITDLHIKFNIKNSVVLILVTTSKQRLARWPLIIPTHRYFCDHSFKNISSISSPGEGGGQRHIRVPFCHCYT